MTLVLYRDEQRGLIFREGFHRFLIFSPQPCSDCLADVVNGFLFVFTLRNTARKCGALDDDPTVFCNLESNVKCQSAPL